MTQYVSGHDALHPYVRPLTLSDVESCVTMEVHSFAEHERCTRDKIVYRLTKSSELSLGLFATAPTGSRLAQDATAATALPIDSMFPDRKEVLIGMIVATKCRDRTVLDDAMGYPDNYREPMSPPSVLGHQEDGRTIALHSLAVLPRHRGKGMGRTILTSFIQRMASAGTADRISLIAHDYLIKFYEKFGFQNVGESSAQFGGGGWHDFIIEV
ncbi:MAG: DNA damage-inducible protein 1 [Chaenotheca gracillima]|nr:MAG: DNA damage-inducible protein 1 [Chaenotheca gracillima]